MQLFFPGVSLLIVVPPQKQPTPGLRHPLLLFSPFPTHCGHLNHVYPENLPEHLQGCSPNFLSDRLSHLFIVSSPVMSFSGVSRLNPALLQRGSKRSHYSSSADPGIPLYWRKLAFRGKTPAVFLTPLFWVYFSFFPVPPSFLFPSTQSLTKLIYEYFYSQWFWTLCEGCKEKRKGLKKEKVSLKIFLIHTVVL